MMGASGIVGEVASNLNPALGRFCSKRWLNLGFAQAIVDRSASTAPWSIPREDRLLEAVACHRQRARRVLVLRVPELGQVLA